MPITPAISQGLLRQRDGHHARVTYEELFFDLVYVFAVTQLSHQLLHHLTFNGVAQTLVLWFAVWLGWQYTCWVTNWFDPETFQIRGMLFCTMLLGLLMASSIPEAFAERGLVFALAYAAMQVGRTAFIWRQLPAGDPLALNYRRMLGWVCISAVFWIAGALASPDTRLLLWLLAVLCEYVSPMFGFALPGLGRSHTQDWTIEGGHLAERCQLFVIVALGETLLASGATLADTGIWSWEVLMALAATFIGTLAMWWLYFGTSSKDATAAITHAEDPGRIGAYFHYVHAILIAGKAQEPGVEPLEKLNCKSLVYDDIVGLTYDGNRVKNNHIIVRVIASTDPWKSWASAKDTLERLSVEGKSALAFSTWRQSSSARTRRTPFC